MSKHEPQETSAAHPAPDWRGKVYDAETHQWRDAAAPAAPVTAPDQEQPNHEE